MLTISKALSATQAATYHAKEFANSDQRYYSQDAQVVGEWQGRLADQWGLAGPIEAEQFGRLAQGQHPETGDQLVKHRQSMNYEQDGKTVTSAEHRAGWDATFSAPKSVSLTALVGGDDRVMAAHRESVRIALEELERYTQARIGGNHPAETTGKFIAAKFEHDTARPVDGYAAPQLHTHAVVFNVTERDNGQTRALQPHELFKSQAFVTAVYQSELMFRLRQLGYEIEAGRSGAPEIKGYSREYLEASSPRSQQIREYLESKGFKGHESAQIAAHQTRDKKQILSREEVLTMHRELAARYCNQADRIVAEARQQSANYRHEPERQIKAAREGVTFARDKNFEREAVTDQRTILRDAMRRSMGEAPFANVRANYMERQQQGEFIVREKPNTLTRLVTTAEALAAERQIIGQMRHGQDRAAPILNDRQLRNAEPQWQRLNESQRGAVRAVLTSQDRIMGIQGYAGTGKTTALESIRSQAEKQGYAIQGVAPTSRAAKQLEQAGIPAKTLQHYLTQPRSGGEGRTLFFVDEASLASTKQMRDFLSRLRPNERVVFVGDIRQHQGVEAGKPFQQLQDAGMKTAQLDTIIRQRDPALKQTVELLAKGKIVPAVEQLKQQSRVHEIERPMERLSAIAKNYVARPEKTLVISPDNQSRRQLNALIHAELQRTGKVQAEEQTLKVLTPRQDMTGAERTWAARYEVNDVIRYSRGSEAIGIKAGEYGTVIEKNEPANLLTVEKADGQQQTYDPRRLQGVTVYREAEQNFSVGDRVQFTAPDKSLEVSNRELGTIERLNAQGDITIRLDSGRSVEFSINENSHLDHGYAVTSHSGQGLTADRALLHIDNANSHPDLINTRLAYVAVSRAQFDVQIFTDNAEQLTKGFSNEVSKTSALELAIETGNGVSEAITSDEGLAQQIDDTPDLSQGFGA